MEEILGGIWEEVINSNIQHCCYHCYLALTPSSVAKTCLFLREKNQRIIYVDPLKGAHRSLHLALHIQTCWMFQFPFFIVVVVISLFLLMYTHVHGTEHLMSFLLRSVRCLKPLLCCFDHVCLNDPRSLESAYILIPIRFLWRRMFEKTRKF